MNYHVILNKFKKNNLFIVLNNLITAVREKFLSYYSNLIFKFFTENYLFLVMTL